MKPDKAQVVILAAQMINFLLEKENISIETQVKVNFYLEQIINVTRKEIKKEEEKEVN